MGSTLVRSYLYAPGSREALLAKVFTAGADAVVLDLEDAVPAAEKDRARKLVADALAGASKDGPEIWVRINDLDDDQWGLDLQVLGPVVAGVRVPKCESVAALADLDHELAKTETRLGLDSGALAVVCLIESACGVMAAPVLAAHPRVARLAFGAADFVADIGASPDLPEATLMARSQLVLASRAEGLLPPIAAVWTDLEDDPGLRASTIENRQLGFFGRSCIHPRQLAVVHEEHTPSAAELEHAREVVTSYAKALENGSATAVSSAGRFIDPAVLRQARGLIELAANLASEPGATVEG